MDSLRKRIPFKLAQEEASDDTDNLILDEQQQEELLSQFREKSVQTNQTSTKYLMRLLTFSLLLHVFFFFRNATTVFSRLLSIFQIGLHTYLLMALLKVLDTSPNRSNTVPADVNTSPDLILLPKPWIIGASCFAPVASVIARETLFETAWWSVGLLLILAIQLCLQWMHESSASIEELERLKYNAKGA